MQDVPFHSNENKLSGTQKRINENNKNFTVVSEPTLKKLKWENSAASCSNDDTLADTDNNIDNVTIILKNKSDITV